ncbi:MULTISPECIES: hypothetical protein [unclassified Streptomyces]|uniref:hypothetical protein n=1 Tax=unclassified Streptomyces TaxID=2593676 RepID=UPI00382D51B1
MTCQWCQGTGYTTRALAYAPGVDPFRGSAETVHRAGECRRCRGTGRYDPRHDPTLDHRRGEGRPDAP